MEFCYKFYGNMEFQIVSFGLLLSLLTLNGAECHCNYFQNLEPGQTYYVYNPTYPNYTRGENNCMWKMSSDYNIEIQCDIEMLSYNCDLNSLFFQFVENNAPMEEYYCTNRTFGPRRLSGDAAIEFNSHIDTKGARFLCKMKTLYNNNNCDCGWKKVTRIVGGKETGINEYPMMCGLVDNSENSGEIYCGGTIISHLYVLTAAHCIETRNIQKDIAVVIGEHNVKTNTETSATRVLRLKGCISHPLYYSSTDAFDIAVCKTVENIIFSAEVGPACLPFLHKRNTFENEIVTALGWGTLEFAGKASDTLQKVDLKVIPNQICKENSLNVNSNNMCTYADGKDTCQRDSGGPLLWKDRSTDRCVLVGVTSTGAGCAAAGTPAVAMRVGAFIDWIKFVTPDAEYCQIE